MTFCFGIKTSLIIFEQPLVFRGGGCPRYLRGMIGYTVNMNSLRSHTGIGREFVDLKITALGEITLVVSAANSLHEKQVILIRIQVFERYLRGSANGVPNPQLLFRHKFGFLGERI